MMCDVALSAAGSPQTTITAGTSCLTVSEICWREEIKVRGRCRKCGEIVRI